MRAMGSGEAVLVERADRRWSRRNQFGLALGAIVALGFIARVAYALTIGQRLTFGLDTIWYELQAGTIANGAGYVDPHAYYGLSRLVPTDNFPPLWPAALALAIK